MTDEVVKPKRKNNTRKSKGNGTQAASSEAGTAATQGAAEKNAASREASSRMASQLDLLAGVAGTTTRIVQQAVSVLEEELASGITITQNFEQKYVDVEKLRSADSQEVIQRFRKDAHDMVDILIDLVNVTSNALNEISQRAVSIGISQSQAKEKTGNDSAGGIPALTVGTPVKPGQAVEIPMKLENDSDKPTEAFFFLSSDLVNSEGERIAAQQISFAPDKLVIDPRKSAMVTVTVQVPESALPGTYSGLLQATRMQQLRAVLSIQIE